MLNRDIFFHHARLWLMLLAGSTPFASAVDPTQLIQAFDTQIKPFLTNYCLDFHNNKSHKGDLDLSNFSTGYNGTSVLAKIGIWKEAAGRVHAQDMPPASKPGKENKQPSESERTQFITWVRNLKHLSPKDPGRGTIRRLSQVEYANTLRDLLGVDPKVASQVPQDMIGEGFSSSISPILMEKYLLVADEILDQAIKPEQLQIGWQAGELDLMIAGKLEPGKADGGTRTLIGPGELITTLAAPADGTYTIKVRAATEQVLGNEPTRLAVRMDNKVVGEIKITANPKSPKTYSISCKLPAGRSKLSFLMLNPFVEVKPTDPKRTPQPTPPKPPADKAKGQDSKDGKPEAPKPSQELRSAIIEMVEVIGPPAAKPSDLQKRLFVAVPSKDIPKRDAAKKIAESFARRAYRRPPTTGEIDGLLKIFDLADQQDEVFASSVKLMLKAVLISPAFIYLTPDDGSITGKNKDIVPLGDHQLAAKLSYLFFGQPCRMMNSVRSPMRAN